MVRILLKFICKKNIESWTRVFHTVHTKSLWLMGFEPIKSIKSHEITIKTHSNHQPCLPQRLHQGRRAPPPGPDAPRRGRNSGRSPLPRTIGCLIAIWQYTYCININLNLKIYICVCKYIYTYIYIYTHIYICTHIYIYIYMCVNIYI